MSNAVPLTDRQRIAYADYLTACFDTVCLATCEEVTAIRERALAGEFDADISAGGIPAHPAR